MPRLTKVGHGVRKLDSGTEWPCDIWISHDDERYPIALGEGIGHGSVGCTIPAEGLLEEKWADVVAICDCQWLVNEIRRLHESGETITAEGLESTWRLRS